MSRSVKVVLIVLLTIALLFAGTVTLTAAAVYQAGSISIDIEDETAHGSDFSLRVPAALVYVAAALVPVSLVPDDALCEVQPFMPMLRAGAEGLAKVEDGVFVEVRSHNDLVRISKESNVLRILVDSPDGRVDVGVPIGAIGVVARRFERAAAG